MIAALDFAHLGRWPWLAIAPVAAAVLWIVVRARRQAHRHTLGERAEPLTHDVRWGGRAAEIALFAAGLFFAVTALLEPRLGMARGDTSWQGMDVVVALDVSRSMRARDLDPDRLTFAKRTLAPLMARAHGDRFALVLFAGEARLRSPLTADHASLVELAQSAEPSSVPKGGTDLGVALETCLRALRGRAKGTPGAILVLTDGEDFSGRGERLARRCHAQGIAVHCVGLGSTRGRKIPTDADGESGFVRDRSGNEVVSAMDARSLRAVATAGGGDFVVADDVNVLADLYDKHILPQAELVSAASLTGSRAARFQWPLCLAVLLWMAAMYVRTRRLV